MTTIHFVFRPSTLALQPGSISMRITHQRVTQAITLPTKILECEWNRETERTTNPIANQEIDHAQNIAQQIIARFSEQGAYSSHDIIQRYRLLTQANSLDSFAHTLAQELTAHDKARTARAYLSATKRLIAFCGNADILLSHITASLMNDFEQSLYADGLARNTTSSYMRSLRAIYNKAVDVQLIVPQAISPFRYVFTGVEATRKRALNTDEINRLTAVNLQKNEKLFFALQLFLFGFHAKGMSFVDMAYLRKSDLRNGTIRYRRRKTKGLITLKVTSALQEIINYFAPMTAGSTYLLPIITHPDKNARLQYESALRLQNKRLNALGKLAKLPYPLSTHVCRHSWASLAKHLDTPLAVISDSLGHSDQKTTQIYLASIGQDILDKVSEQVSQLVLPPPPLYGYGLGYCRL